MSNVNFRANRFRHVDRHSLLVPPPLPLINLPEDPRQAQTGLPDERPLNLPIRRHVPNSVAMALLKSKGLNVDGLTRWEPEPILREKRALQESEIEEYQDLEELARLHVYEYNEPNIARNNKAPKDTLVFDSLFESGNLLRAERIHRKVPVTESQSSIPQQEYELLIHPDVKNGAYRQWFYFEVRNGKPGITYRFALVNFAKRNALFGQGLQPVVYSEKDAATKGLGWRHQGTHVRYGVAMSSRAPLGASALTFHYEFEHENDCVYFACLQPYTYTDLMDYLDMLERDPQRSLVCRRTELCQSLAGNSCDMLSITSPDKDGLLHDERRIIVVSARVHPGEPNSSWMMQGMINYLTGPSSGATVLRRNFVFKLVPMLNPDGVINGNTRVNLAGWDLNRKWSNPIEQLFPTIYHLKQQLMHFQSRGRVAIYCDLHGHSINRNVFTYGCYPSNKSSSLADDMANSTSSGSNTGVKADPRVFPMIVARHARCFSFANCDFSVHRSKISTARVVVNQELGVINSYTLEASFCGPDFGVHKDTQFSTYDLEEMGRSWCQSLLVYYGLTSQVKALDAERTKRATCGQQQEKILGQSSHQNGEVQGIDVLNGEEVDDEESRLARDLLLDCEAAISALFEPGVDVNDPEGCEEDIDTSSFDSDLSGAEEEAIPPSHEDGAIGCNPQPNTKQNESLDDDADSITSGSDEVHRAKLCFSRNNRTRHKPRRESITSKMKSVAHQVSRKSSTKKKRKHKVEQRRPLSTTASPSVMSRSKAASTVASDLQELVIIDPDPAPKPVTKSASSVIRARITSIRPKSSSATPKSVSSAILQSTTKVNFTSSRATLRHCPIPKYPNISDRKLLALPKVSSESKCNLMPRILKTAPGYDCVLDTKSSLKFIGARSELPVLHLLTHDDEQRRHLSLPRKVRRHDNAMTCDRNSEPKSYATCKLFAP